MKTIVLILVVACSMAARAEDVVIGDTKNTHQNERFTWVLSSDQIRKLPEWKKEASLPLSPQDAEALAYKWSRRQNLRGWIPERPFSISLVRFPAAYEERYFYKIAFASTEGDSFWTVHVLMDGSVVEPKKTEPNQSPEPTAGLRPAAAHL